MPFIGAKVTLIRNGIYEINFLPQEEARRKLNIPPNVAAVGTIAELTKNKGLNYLVDAAAKIREARFYVASEGEEKMRLEEQIEKQKLTGRFKLLGFLPDASTYLVAFNIFVLPSLKEDLPYVILEAGLAGLPVVASHVAITLAVMFQPLGG